MEKAEAHPLRYRDGSRCEPKTKAESLGEDDTGLMTPDDANPELPMAAFATLWKDIPWR